MGILRKILLLDLPENLENALKEQFLARENIAVTCALEMQEGVIFDLILCKNTPQDNTLPCAVPLLSLGIGRRERLGTVLGQIERMMDDPLLWLEDFQLGPYMFHPSEKTLTGKTGDITLTDREADILVFLARHENKTVSRDILLKNVWRYHEDADTHTLETHIYRLRQKIEIKADMPEILVTEDGGYRLSFQGGRK